MRRGSRTVEFGVAHPGRVRRLRQWWMQSNSALMASTAFLLLLATVGVWLLVFPQSSPAPAIDPAAPTASAVPTTSPAPIAASCVEQPAVPVTPETLVLTGYPTNWYQMGDVFAPRSTTGGPISTTAVECFARTPEGALYSIATRVAMESVDAGVGDWRFSGYRWDSYDPDIATVTLAVRRLGGEGFGTARTFTAVWDHADWRVRDPESTGIDTADSLRTFTPWGG